MQGVSRSNSGLALFPLFTFGYISCTLGVGPSLYVPFFELQSYWCAGARLFLVLTLVYHAAHCHCVPRGLIEQQGAGELPMNPSHIL